MDKLRAERIARSFPPPGSMSATDDAFSSSRDSSSSSRRTVRATIVVAAIALGAVLGARFGPLALPDSIARWTATVAWRGAAPADAEWPRPPRAGEFARVRGAGDVRVLEVTAARAGDASHLASAMAAERSSGARLDQARREALERGIAAAEVFGPLPSLTSEAEAAALLRAHARVARARAGSGVAASAAPADAAEQITAYAVAEAALAGDRIMLDDALEASLVVERERLAQELGAPGAAALARDRWEARLLRFAQGLDAHAAQLEGLLPAGAGEIAALAEPGIARAIAARFATPSELRLAMLPPDSAPRVRPRRAIFAALAAAGALLGALIGLLAARALPRAAARVREPLAARVRNAVALRRRAALAPVTATAPSEGADGAWLQIVSGARARDAAAAAMEVAARGVAAGGRVLVVDAGQGLDLHRAFGAEPHPGLIECLVRPLPALGMVQQGGVPRLLFLARGSGRLRPVWIHLDHLLEEVRPHCDRLVLALAADAPREVGSMLAGRVMDAWWGSPGAGRVRAMDRLSNRLGIAFIPLNLRPGDQATLEILKRRVSELAPAPPAPVVPDAASAEAAPPIPPPALGEVLDSDLQVRERLRFLAWMRRVEAEGRREELISSD